MAKKNPTDDAEETGLTTAVTTVGALLPADFEALMGDGFASIDTVLLGDPQDSKMPMYAGRMIGPGEPVLIGDDANHLTPTWAFHPVTRKDGVVGFAENVTHIIPASYMIHAACARIFKECERNNVGAIVGFLYRGKK